MTARIVLVGMSTGTAATGLGEALAEAIRAPHVIAPEPVGGAAVEAELGASTDGFVLEAYPRDRDQAEALDAFLEARAASIEIALWVRSDAAPTAAEDALLEHYRHRVVEVELEDTDDEAELLTRTLDRVREASESLVG